MRVQIVAELYPQSINGIAVSARRIATHLALNGHLVQVFTYDSTLPLNEPDYQLEHVDRGVRVVRFGPCFVDHLNASKLGERHRAALRRRIFSRMFAEATRFRPDVVFGVCAFNAGHLAQLVANALDVPCVIGIRGNDVGLGIFHAERFAVVRWVLESQMQ